MLKNFAKNIISSGGFIKPILIDRKDMINPSLMNPTILKTKDKLLLSIRNTNYLLYHAEKNVNEHIWGPLTYLHPENEMALITHNILCELDSSFNIVNNNTVDTTQCDQSPIWHFIGLEDARLCHWDDKLFLCGVRRDTTENGEGRIELSEIIHTPEKTIEISRQRMPAPGNNDSYCEKNWMPIIDKPYHFIKWSNPTEVVKFDPVTKTTNTVYLSDLQYFPGCGDIRGGSQVIRFGNYYVALTHEVALYYSEAGRKDGEYYHRFVAWDENFNIVKISDRINFLGGKIEFSCGICLYQDNILITFAFQDNAAFILGMSQQILRELLGV
jgi:hypothetical protein